MTDQYIELGKKIINEGVWIKNERTGKRCLTIINHDLEYDVGAGKFPLVTTRKSYWKQAVSEIIGYLRGYTNANQFVDLGTNTWLANANENKVWLNNRHRSGDGDMGKVYGYQMRDFGGSGYDQLLKVISNLENGIDDRGEILQMWNPAEFDKGCLRPCMYEHQFSLLGDTLYLNSTQRSCDVPLGLNFNMVQVYFLLFIVAHITGHKAGKAYHKIINAHIYEDQIDNMLVQMERKPFKSPKFNMVNRDISSIEDLLTWVDSASFEVSDYDFHEPIVYSFSV